MKNLFLNDRDKMIHALQKRIRELECINDIFRIVANLDSSFDQILQDIAETIPRGFLNPNYICSSLTVAGRTARSANFTNSPCKFEAAIDPDSNTNGNIQVGYLAPLPYDNITEINHEKEFLQVLADQISMVLRCKIMKDSLQESEWKYRFLAENSLVGIFQTTLNGEILYANHACLQMLGYDDFEDFAGHSSVSYYRYPEDRKTALKILEQNGSLHNFETELITRKGKSIFVLFNGILESGVVTGMMMDITEQRSLINSLEESRKQLAQAQRIAHLGSWEWDTDTGEVKCSDEAYRIFGREPQQIKVTYAGFLQMVHPDDRAMLDQIARNILIEKERRDPVELRIILPDKSERMVQLRGEFNCNDDGKPIRMIGTVLDITKSKQAESSLKNAYEEIKQLKERLEAENIYLRDEVESFNGNTEVIGISDPIRYINHRIRQVAPTDTTVLLRGETGVGKNVFARLIHRESNRRNKPLIQVNCAGLPADLIESELFGREKGAFTGSTARQIGRFELAHKGTILLDEIGELPIELQPKLLKVIEDGTFERLGSPQTIKVDVRIIACTNRNLEEEIKNGRFRQDLFFRLNVFPITIPSLRRRKEDIPLFVMHYVQKFKRKFGRKIERIPRQLMDEFENYDWPGNVRELINVIERAVIVSTGAELHLAESMEAADHCLVCEIMPQIKPSSEPQFLADVERNHILQALHKTSWRVEGPHGAAKILGLNPNTLRSRMRKMGIKKPGKTGRLSDSPK